MMFLMMHKNVSWDYKIPKEGMNHNLDWGYRYKKKKWKCTPV